MDPELRLLRTLLDEGFGKASWHGPNLSGSLRGVTAEEAAWRPSAGRHNIWELTVHAAYWKYAARRRLAGEKRGSFPLKGSNWFPRSGEGGKAAWRDDLQLLRSQHEALRAAVGALRTVDTRESRLIRGVAVHDLYHAGQIQLLKRLQRSASR